MDQSEISLGVAGKTVGYLFVPPIAARDIPTLKAQIELRQHALRELQLVRARLRPFMRVRRECPPLGLSDEAARMPIKTLPMPVGSLVRESRRRWMKARRPL